MNGNVHCASTVYSTQVRHKFRFRNDKSIGYIHSHLIAYKDCELKSVKP